MILAEANVVESVKGFINWLCKPDLFLTLSCVVFVLMFVFYKIWTKPVIFTIIFVGFLLFYFGSMADPDYRSIVAKPDNVPITMMVISVFFCIWLSFRRAALN